MGSWLSASRNWLSILLAALFGTAWGSEIGACCAWLVTLVWMLSDAPPTPFWVGFGTGLAAWCVALEARPRPLLRLLAMYAAGITLGAAHAVVGLADCWTSPAWLALLPTIPTGKLGGLLCGRLCVGLPMVVCLSLGPPRAGIDCPGRCHPPLQL